MVLSAVVGQRGYLRRHVMPVRQCCGSAAGCRPTPIGCAPTGACPACPVVERFSSTAVQRVRATVVSARWWDWEGTSDGRRQITWSSGDRRLRRAAQLGEAKTDEEVPDQDCGGEERLTTISPDGWRETPELGVTASALDIAENLGCHELARWLEVIHTGRASP